MLFGRGVERQPGADRAIDAAAAAGDEGRDQRCRQHVRHEACWQGAQRDRRLSTEISAERQRALRARSVLDRRGETAAPGVHWTVHLQASRRKSYRGVAVSVIGATTHESAPAEFNQSTFEDLVARLAGRHGYGWVRRATLKIFVEHDLSSGILRVRASKRQMAEIHRIDGFARHRRCSPSSGRR